SLVRAPAVAVVELAEGVVVAEELPEREGGLGEGEAGQHFAVKVLWHGPGLGTRRGRSPTTQDGSEFRFGQTRKRVGGKRPLAGLGSVSDQEALSPSAP